MSYEKYIDKRPYKPTTFLSNDFAVITRKNVDTDKMHTVKMNADLWLKYYKSEIKNIELLIDAGLTKEQILFVHKNIIKGETPKPKNINPTKKKR